MRNAFEWFGRHGQVCLIAGLSAGLALPSLAELLRPWIGPLVAALLFITGTRVGAKAALGSLGDLGGTLGRLALFQFAAPVLAFAIFSALNLLHHPLALAVVLMLAAPSLTGAPNFAIMMGSDPAPAMRLLVIGTAMFPLSAFPVFALLDLLGGGVVAALTLSSELMAAIMVSVGAGFALRAVLGRLAVPISTANLDSAAALLLAVVVVGLMSAIGPMLRSDPAALALWVLAAFAVYFTLALLALTVAKAAKFTAAIPTGIFASNRNIALFLIVLPETVAAPLMVFVGCYQIPMYLTPFIFSKLKAFART